MSWINDLDACASAGIISFDAPAYIRDAQPRYVGNPDFATLPQELVPIKRPVQKDTFTPSDPHNNPVWKKVLFGAVAAAAVVGGVILGKKLFKSPKIVKRIKVNSKLALRWIKNIPTKIKNLHLMDKLKGLFKKP